MSATIAETNHRHPINCRRPECADPTGSNICPRCSFANIFDSTLCHDCGKDLCSDDDVTCEHCGGVLSSSDPDVRESERGYVHLEC